MCLFRFTWINDLDGEGQVLITCFCLASVNCGPRTAVPELMLLGKIAVFRSYFLGVLAQAVQAQWTRKITTQQAKTSKVNTVSCILLNILASIYLLESFTWIPIQILYIHGHFYFIFSLLIINTCSFITQYETTRINSHTELGLPVVLVFEAVGLSSYITETRPLKNVAREKWGTH